MLRYISPSSFHSWKMGEEYFINNYFLSRVREVTGAMIIGSAFDTFVKHNLLIDLGQENDLLKLYNESVDEDWRTWGWEKGQKVFKQYVELGAYERLFNELRDAENIDLSGDIYGTVNDIPMRGKPDLTYYKDGKLIVSDWKCNNYIGTRKISPLKFYCWSAPTGKAHRRINEFVCFSEVDKKWATQTLVYSWLLGEEEFTAQIEQMLFDPEGVRYFLYKGTILKEFAENVKVELKTMWERINSQEFKDRVAHYQKGRDLGAGKLRGILGIGQKK